MGVSQEVAGLDRLRIRRVALHRLFQDASCLLKPPFSRFQLLQPRFAEFVTEQINAGLAALGLMGQRLLIDQAA